MMMCRVDVPDVMPMLLEQMQTPASDANETEDDPAMKDAIRIFNATASLEHQARRSCMKTRNIL